MDGCVDRWVDRWMVVWMERWTDEFPTYQLSALPSLGMGSSSLSLKSKLAFGSCGQNKRPITNSTAVSGRPVGGGSRQKPSKVDRNRARPTKIERGRQKPSKADKNRARPTETEQGRQKPSDGLRTERGRALGTGLTQSPQA